MRKTKNLYDFLRNILFVISFVLCVFGIKYWFIVLLIAIFIDLFFDE